MSVIRQIESGAAAVSVPSPGTSRYKSSLHTSTNEVSVARSSLLRSGVSSRAEFDTCSVALETGRAASGKFAGEQSA